MTQKETILSGNPWHCTWKKKSGRQVSEWQSVYTASVKAWLTPDGALVQATTTK